MNFLREIRTGFVGMVNGWLRARPDRRPRGGGARGRRLRSTGGRIEQGIPGQDVMPQRHGLRKTRPGGGACGGRVNKRGQKTFVTPLTGPASRSVMRHNYQSPHVEGPAAILDPSSDRIDCQNAGRIDSFARWIIGLAQ